MACYRRTVTPQKNMPCFPTGHCRAQEAEHLDVFGMWLAQLRLLCVFWRGEEGDQISE